jgi:hypothetical protein
VEAARFYAFELIWKPFTLPGVSARDFVTGRTALHKKQAMKATTALNRGAHGTVPSGAAMKPQN